jgi:hypothetical protein
MAPLSPPPPPPPDEDSLHEQNRIEVDADEFMTREEAKQLLEKSKNWNTFPNLETARKVSLARLNIEFSEMVDHTKACVSIRIPKPDAKTRKENVVNQSDTRWKPFYEKKNQSFDAGEIQKVADEMDGKHFGHKELKLLADTFNKFMSNVTSGNTLIKFGDVTQLTVDGFCEKTASVPPYWSLMYSNSGGGDYHDDHTTQNGIDVFDI